MTGQSITDQALPILEARSVGKYYDSSSLFKGRKNWVNADISLSLRKGETLGLVGESGSGKTTLGRMLAGLLLPSAGQVFFDGVDINANGRRGLRETWRRLQMVFQDPFASLNPKMNVGQALAEPLRNFGICKGAEARTRSLKVLADCGLPQSSLDKYPSEFSGGQRQRIGIARALVMQPEVIIADEPVSALDVSVQAQVLNLLVELQAEYRLTLVFIGHDLAVVRHMSDRVAVMNKGRVVELADAATIYDRPADPYTQSLLGASLIPDPRVARSQLYA